MFSLATTYGKGPWKDPLTMQKKLFHPILPFLPLSNSPLWFFFSFRGAFMLLFIAEWRNRNLYFFTY